MQIDSERGRLNFVSWEGVCGKKKGTQTGSFRGEKGGESLARRENHLKKPRVRGRHIRSVGREPIKTDGKREDGDQVWERCERLEKSKVLGKDEHAE